MNNSETWLKIKMTKANWANFKLYKLIRYYKWNEFNGIETVKGKCKIDFKCNVWMPDKTFIYLKCTLLLLFIFCCMEILTN